MACLFVVQLFTPKAAKITPGKYTNNHLFFNNTLHN